MTIVGIIKKGELVGEKIQYNCIKCNTSVELEFNDIISVKTKQVWCDLAHGQICLDCHVNDRIPEIAECLMH